MTTRTLAAGAVALLLAGCGSAPDLSAVRTEEARSVKRQDVVQSLAANGRVVVAGTQDGAVLASADGGKTWNRQPLAGPASLLGLAACPDRSFIAIDFYHRVWHGDADGKGWHATALDKPRVPLAVACDGQGRWWVSGAGAKLAVSADQGATWTVTDLGEDAQITTLQILDGGFGVALGEFGLLATSRDGGATWQKGPALPGEFYPYAALFLDAKEGWASGLAGQVLHTRDGGLTWRKDANPAGVPLYRLFLHDGVPHGVGAGGAVARYTADAGGAWRPVAYPDAVPVYLGAGASLGGHALALGGPGGLVRVIDTAKN